MSETDDITGRWFKQLLTTLRETELEAAEAANASTTQESSVGSIYHSSLGGDQFENSPLDEVS